MAENFKSLTAIKLSVYAEREGFEPPVRANGQRFSRPPQSTTLPSLRERQKYNFFLPCRLTFQKIKEMLKKKPCLGCFFKSNFRI